ncbi:MAG: SDR family NAD(P)-dependent oxidoreductase [Candidatus Promineifilaceae bacterium]|nr:SDR family NAD(P)-dependent oxidoreductase [Candidatus Promineifilaceae bacterium]
MSDVRARALGAAGDEQKQPLVGLVEWFHYQNYDQVEQTLAHLAALGINELRTGISWADAHRPEGMRWLRWLLDRLTEEVNVLPCFVYTPPSRGLEPKTSSPPRALSEYGEWVCWIIEQLGDNFEWVELWNEPNNLSEWDWTLDPGWEMFAKMIRRTAKWVQALDKRVLLGGMSPIDPAWLARMGRRGVLEHMDAVGIHGFPGVWEADWIGWEENVRAVRQVLAEHESEAAVWITETGYSTWRHDQAAQVQAFLDVLEGAREANVERVYWYALRDLAPHLPTIDGFHLDEREYHFGLVDADDNPKLLYRLLTSGGIPAAREMTSYSAPVHIARSIEEPILITGGAGFVGTNLAHRLLEAGETVLVYDILARAGVEKNLRWLREQHGERLQVALADVRDRYALQDAVDRARQIYHLAGQVAVTTSVEQPERDFEVNLRGTINLLEALRRRQDPPPLLFTSTNKVYGDLEGVTLEEEKVRYEPTAPGIRAHGIDESQRLSFHSPYGCSKGAADQYILDYARIYDLPATVFRMSCIYGPHQFGTEDQGWLAHFLIATLEGQPLTIFGDGKQVRDVLFVADLVDAMLLAMEQIGAVSGRAFNIGGGPDKSISLLQCLELITEIHGEAPQFSFAEWRPGDQRYYVSDTRRFQEATGWEPATDVRTGLTRLYEWLRAVRNLDALHLLERGR